MEHELLRERSRINARHDAALRRWSNDRNDPELRREIVAVVDALEENLIALEAAGLGPLELARTTRWIGDACADLARPQRIPRGEDRAWLLRALSAYHRACELLEGLAAPRDMAVLAFNNGNAIRRLDMEDLELLEAAKLRYEAALGYFDAHEPERAVEIHEALDSLRVLLEIAPPARRTETRADVAAVKAALRAEEDACDPTGEVGDVVTRCDGEANEGPMRLVNRVAAIVAGLPPSGDE